MVWRAAPKLAPRSRAPIATRPAPPPGSQASRPATMASAVSPPAPPWKRLCETWRNRIGRPGWSTNTNSGQRLLAGPDNPVNEGDVAQAEMAVLEHQVEAFEFDALGRHAAQLLGHHLAGAGLDHHPIAAP